MIFVFLFGLFHRALYERLVDLTGRDDTSKNGTAEDSNIHVNKICKNNTKT